MQGGPVLLFLCICVHDAISLDTIDTVEPIIRSAPSSLDPYGYFGFSTVLHRTDVNGLNSFSDYLEKTRIIVSAPNGTAENSQVDNTGVLYSCTVTQGDCDPLLGDENGDDRFLYDILANNADEDKSKQFLGISMDTSNNMFIVCAHRYFLVQSTRYPRGRCFYTTNRDLTNFMEYAPCDGRSTSRGNFGQCVAGTSVLLADDDTTTDSSSLPIIVGAPGSREWRGNLFRRRVSGTTDLTGTGEGTNFYSWQGYSMTRGHFISTTREDIAVSVPRSNNYFGQVNIVRNNNGLDFEGQTLIGTAQMGEYFGFTLAAADLNGDGFDELLVGAPMYSPTGVPEAGQVYLYKNNNGNLEIFRLFTAPVNEEYARFGHSISNLGDINGDGLDDVAIGAPFGAGSGTVYIYYGSVADTITPSAQQIIIGSEITSPLSVPSPKGFGFSLFSNLDVDGNGINDLLVGAYESQNVFLLRSRAVANIPVTITASPTIVNLDTKLCDISGTSYACFNLTACATFPALGNFAASNDLSLTLEIDRQNIELGLQQRVFFNTAGMPSSNTEVVNFSPGQEQCIIRTVYIRDGIADRFNGFPVELSLTSQSFTTTSTDGNPVPTDLSPFPIIMTSGQSNTQVETFKDCNGGVCVPDLQLSLLNITYESGSGTVSSDSFVAGRVTNFNVWVTLTNNGEDGFLTSITFSILTAQFEFIRILPRDLLITCTSVVGNEQTILTCPIANPLAAGRSRTIGIRLRPTNGLRPSEGSFSFTFTATTLNDEDASTLDNNAFTVAFVVSESADIYLDQAVADPEQVSYTTNITTGNLTVPEDLGPPITVSYVVRNAGPSTIPETEIRIFWPVREIDSEYYYLYPLQIQRSISNSIDCIGQINPLNLISQSDQDQVDNEGDESNISNGKKRRRRSISPLKRKKRNISKRQEMVEVDEVEDVLINCRTNPELCSEYVCTIRQLSGGSSVQLDMVSYLDERYFQSRSDRFTFVPYANVTIVTNSIQQPEVHLADDTEVQIRVVTSVPPPRRGSSVEPWVIIVPIVLGVIFFIIIGIILYFVGFFRRKNMEKKEEIAAQFLEAQQGGDTVDDLPGDTT